MEAEEKKFDLTRIATADAIALAIVLGASAYAWTQIPDGTRLPTHWGANGEVNGYGSKQFALLVLPVVAVLIAALNLALPSFDPRKHLVQSQRGYNAIWTVLMAWLAILHCAMISMYLGSGLKMQQVMPVMIGVLFVGIGNYMGKIRSNFYMGVRTPWTLSSEESWNRTNRLGGILFMILGAVGAITGLIDGRLFLGALLGLLPAMGVALIIYSYYVWKGDPAKNSRA